MTKIMTITEWIAQEMPKTVLIEDKSTIYETVRVAASSVKVSGIDPPEWAKWRDDGSGSVGVYGYVFPADKTKEAFMTVTLPHHWVPQSYVIPKIHWTTPDATEAATNVCWGLEFTFAECGNVFGTTVTLHANVADCGADVTQYGNHITSFAPFPTTSLTTPIIGARIFRDVSDATLPDTFTGDATLLEGNLVCEVKHWSEY